MTGKSHIAMNLATAVAATDTYLMIARLDAPAGLQTAAEASFRFLTDFGGTPVPIALPASIGMYFLGALLPDIDHEYSMLGKIVHVPVAHRTWLHAVYIISLPFLLLGLFPVLRPLFWLGLGAFFHLFWDSFSRSGNNWFYPHKAKRHRLKLYRTSSPSEYVFCTVIWVVTALYTLVTIWLTLLPDILTQIQAGTSVFG